MYIFVCEDSLDGIMTGIYDAWSFKIEHKLAAHSEIHLASTQPDNYELFCEYIHVVPAIARAEKVRHTLLSRFGTEFYEDIANAALSKEPAGKKDMDKADALYQTIVMALSSTVGAKVLTYLGEPCVYRVFTLARGTQMEAHHLMGFLRFSELKNGVLFSTIHPKNNALPILAEHFTDRFPQENFMIYDGNRKTAALHRAGSDFLLVDASDLNQDIIEHLSEKEEDFRALWLTFFESVAIQARINPDLQAQNIPKRFWPDAVELRDKL